VGGDGDETVSDMFSNNNCSIFLGQLLHLSIRPRWKGLVYNVTAPTCFVSNYFDDRIGSRAYDGIGNQTTSLTTMYPVVSTQCIGSTIPHTGFEANTGLYYLSKNGTLAENLFSFHTLIDRVLDSSGFGNTTRVWDEIPDGDGGAKEINYPPIWTLSPEPDANSLIVVFPSWTGYGTIEWPPSLLWLLTQPDSEPSRRGVRFEACTISAFYTTGEIQLIEQPGTSIVQTSAAAMLELHEARPITLDVTGIEIIQRAEFYRDIVQATYIETGLSTLFAEAIAVSVNTTLLEEQLPRSYDQHNMSVFPYNTVLYGYGYGSRSISVQLAMVVMMMYSVITVAYITYIVVTGSTSTAWSSAIELVALALQSKAPDHIGHIGVGLDSIKTFKEKVGIRVNKNNELELVFAHDRDIGRRGLRHIERNREY
jgi:hypothetical protein